MNKKMLEIELSMLSDFLIKKPGLEQYPTPSGVAASLLWEAFMKNDIQDKVVLDAGCGNGILGIGALLLGAKKVIFLDIDSTAIDFVSLNCDKFGFENVEIINKDIVDFEKRVDTVIMNPPFGVQKKGLDIVFLKKTSQISDNIYLIYKGDGLKIVKRELPEFKSEVIQKTTLLLKKQFSFHKNDNMRTNVILLRLSKNNQ